MTALVFAAITFVSTLGCAVLGTVLRVRLPQSHLSKDSHDVIRLGMGLVATMTALLLGLVTAAAKGSFDSQDVAVRNAAAGLLSLDRLLARYGPETQASRDLLRQVIADRIDEAWPERGPSRRMTDVLNRTPPAEVIEDQLLALVPENDAQRWFKGEALKLVEEVLRTRWRLLGSAGGSVSWAFLVVVIFWLSMTFASFGLGAPRNPTVLTVFVISSLSVAAAIFLILELDGAFEGLIRISSEPLRMTLANLGKP